MKIPKGTSQFKLNGSELEFLSEKGEKLGSCSARNINFSEQTFFSSILCTCGSDMITISNWVDGTEATEEIYISFWEQPRKFPLSFMERIKNAINSLRGKMSTGGDVMLRRNGLLALRASLDEALLKLDEAKK